MPEAFDTAELSWIDLSNLNTSTEIVNINADRTHDSNWILKQEMSSCDDENGDVIPDPAGLSNIDFSSTGRGKFNLDKPIFAKLPGTNKWALHDIRTIFKSNTKEDPLLDGGGKVMKAAARTIDSGNPGQLVVRCSNAQRNIFNEESCKLSYDADACVSVPIGTATIRDPGGDNPSFVSDYLPSYAGPDNGGVIVCGSENEVAPDVTEDDVYDVTNRKVQSHRINYMDQKQSVWLEGMIPCLFSMFDVFSLP